MSEKKLLPEICMLGKGAKKNCIFYGLLPNQGGDVTSVTLSCLNSINAIDVIR